MGTVDSDGRRMSDPWPATRTSDWPMKRGGAELAEVRQCAKTRSVGRLTVLSNPLILPPVALNSARSPPRPRAPRAARPRRTFLPLLARGKARCIAMSAVSPSSGGLNGGSGFCGFIEDFFDANPGAVAQAALWCADGAPGAGEPPGSAGLVASLPAPPFSDFLCRTGWLSRAVQVRRRVGSARVCFACSFVKTKADKDKDPFNQNGPSCNRQCSPSGRGARRTSFNSQSEVRVEGHGSDIRRASKPH